MSYPKPCTIKLFKIKRMVRDLKYHPDWLKAKMARNYYDKTWKELVEIANR